MRTPLPALATAIVARAVGAVPGCHLKAATHEWRAPPALPQTPAPGTSVPITLRLSGRAPDEHETSIELSCEVAWTEDAGEIGALVLAAVRRRIDAQRARFLRAAARGDALPGPASAAATTPIAHLHADRAMLHHDVAGALASTPPGRRADVVSTLIAWGGAAAAAHRSINPHDGMGTMSGEGCTVADPDGVPTVHRTLSIRDSGRREIIRATGPRVVVPNPPTLPAAVMQGLKGRTLADVVDAPGIYGRRTIASARATRDGLTLQLAPDPFPIQAIADMDAATALALLADDDACAAIVSESHRTRAAGVAAVAAALGME